jgi:hypothetical protein
MGDAMMNSLIAVGVVFAIGYGWLHLQSRSRGSRVAAGRDGGGGGDSYSGTSDGFFSGSWFSSDSSGSSIDDGSCSGSDSGGSRGIAEVAAMVAEAVAATRCRRNLHPMQRPV